MSRRAWTLFGALSAIWGVPYLFIRVAVDGGLPPLDLVWLRIALAAALLLVAAKRAGTLAQLTGHWRWILAYAVAEVVIPFSLIAAGETKVSSSTAAIIIAAVPLMVAGLTALVDPAARPTRTGLAGLAIGFLGVVALVGIDLGGRSGAVLASLGLLVAALGYACGPMLIRYRLAGLDAAATMGTSLALAAAILLVPALLTLPRHTPTAGAFAATAVLGVLCTAIAFLLLPGLVHEAGPTRASVITYINPVVAVLLGVTLLNEHLGAGALVGLALILGGSGVATASRGAAPAPPSTPAVPGESAEPPPAPTN